MKNIYSKFFNLDLNPFGETPDPDFYYASHQHNRALTVIDTALRNGKGFSLLIGEVGTGKTLLSRILIGALSPYANTALILYPKFSDVELLQAILEEFEIQPSSEDLKTSKSYLDQLNRYLLTSLNEGRRSVLVIDEAQAMSVEALEMIRLLTNLETKTQKLLQIVLIGQPELQKTLELPELRQLKQRIGAQADLQGLDSIEVEHYVKSRIEQVGNGNFVRFEVESIRMIHSLSAGIPRRINQLCEQVLTSAEESRVRLITPQFVKEILVGRQKKSFSIFSRKEQK